MDVDLEEVTIEWEGFSTALSGDLWQYYMAKELSDVTISTEDGRDIRSHRIVLALCSAFFRDLFKRNNAPNQIVCLSMRFEVLKKILAFIYRGAVEVPTSELTTFIKAAKLLKLQGFENVSTLMNPKEIGLERSGMRQYSIKLKRVALPGIGSDVLVKRPPIDSDSSSDTPALNGKKDTKSNTAYFPLTDSDEGDAASNELNAQDESDCVVD